MGYQVGSACYPTAVAAAQASASSQVGAVVTQGSASYVVDASSVDGSSITYVLTPVAGGTALTVVSPYTAQACGLLDFNDGLNIGWLMAACWLGTAAVLSLKHAITGWGDQSGNGNT